MFDLLIENNRQDLILKYMKLRHDLKLCDYNTIHSSLMCDKDIEV